MVEYSLSPNMVSPEENTTNISKETLVSTYPILGEVYFKCLDQLIEDTNDISISQYIYNELMKKTKKIDEDTLGQLEQVSSSAETQAPQNVIRARTILKEYFTESEPGQSLRQKGIRPVIYGSIQYGDPKNLDADLLLISEEGFTPDLEKSRLSAESELREIWIEQKIGTNTDAEPHLEACALDLFNDIPAALDKEGTFSFYVQAGDLSVAISGIPVLQEDKEWFTEFSKQAKSVAESDPLICAIVNYNLRNCLEDRISRQTLNQKS